MFSRACEYGIRASIYISMKSVQEKRVSLKEIAAKINSPEAFTAKILQQLAKNKIIRSVKGPSGGFEMDPKMMEEIRLSDIVSAIDGDSIFTTCGLGLKECSETKPCPVHHKFKPIREKLSALLKNTSIRELTSGLKSKTTFLKF